MVEVFYNDSFLHVIHRIKDANFRERVNKLIEKIVNDPEIGKPMRHERKGTREVYIGSFRLSYVFIPEQNRLVFLSIYHKYEQ